MALTKSVRPITADVTSYQDIDGLLAGIAWTSLNLTYSFPDSTTDYSKFYGNGEPSSSFKALNTVQQNAVTTILTEYASISNLSFTLIPFHSSTDATATFRYAESNKPGTAWGYYPSEAAEGGDVWFNNTSHQYDNPVIGNYAWLTVMHETGHTLGLKHAQETDVYGAVPGAHNSLEYSIMSYFSYVGDTAGGYTNATWAYPQTLMQDDIAAIQYLYGADFGYHSGNTTYLWSPTTGALTISGTTDGWTPGGNVVFETIWDGGGIDTYDFHLYSTPLKVDLRPGQWTQTDTLKNFQTADLGAYDNVAGAHYAAGNIANALLYTPYDPTTGTATGPTDLRSLIENAIGGSNNDVFIANQAVNKFTGNAGRDTFIWASLSDLSNSALRAAGATVESVADTITDFTFNLVTGTGDKIDLSAIPNLSSSQLSAANVGTEHFIYADTNGDHVADAAIHVQGTFDVVANWATHDQWLIA